MPAIYRFNTAMKVDRSIIFHDLNILLEVNSLHSRPNGDYDETILQHQTQILKVFNM